MSELARVALRTTHLSKRWGAFVANDDIHLSVRAGSRHALIGPNGAGKTTLVNLLTGLVAPTQGDVFLGDERITHLKPHERVKRGLVRTFQINSLFPTLTALQTVLMAIFERDGLGLSWRHPAFSHGPHVDEARQLLRSLMLIDDANICVDVLPYGKQRLLEIAVALAMRPSILLLDEPAAGIPAAQSHDVFRVLAELPRDVTVIFIEHDMKLVFRFAERITVLVGGKTLVEGTPAEIARNQEVKEVYLGESEHV
jgi:branched-chain amino acid transport system ATP-binding protein